MPDTNVWLTVNLRPTAPSSAGGEPTPIELGGSTGSITAELTGANNVGPVGDSSNSLKQLAWRDDDTWIQLQALNVDLDTMKRVAKGIEVVNRAEFDSYMADNDAASPCGR